MNGTGLTFLAIVVPPCFGIGVWPVFSLIPIAAYLLGSVPFGFILCKLIKGVDIREHGSRNIGATNAGRVCGWPFFAGTFVLDFAKGLTAAALGVGIASWWLGWWESRPANAELPQLLQLLAVLYGLCAIFGHTFPIYLGFKGGKAVATSFGVFVALAPLPATVALVVWLLFFVLFRYVSLASMIAAVAAPIAYAAQYWGALRDHSPVFDFTLAVALLVVVRHRANIGRLLKGTEPRVTHKKT